VEWHVRLRLSGGEFVEVTVEAATQNEAEDQAKALDFRRLPITILAPVVVNSRRVG
jgi:hypothetical protein